MTEDNGDNIFVPIANRWQASGTNGDGFSNPLVPVADPGIQLGVFKTI